jgi:long-chain acyl-CoA synthetase
MKSKPRHGPHLPKGVLKEIPIPDKSVFTLLDDAAKEYPESIYSIFSGTRRSFHHVKEGADRLDRLCGYER